MRDLIDRQQAIQAVADEIEVNGYSRTIAVLRELPSAHPEPCEDAVSRHRLLDDLEELTTAWEKYPVMAEQIKGVETAIGYVKTIPSVTPKEQPEIIRCKDCKHRVVNEHYGERGYLNLEAVCNLDTGDTFELGRDAWNDEWYCADAERREEGGK